MSPNEGDTECVEGVRRASRQTTGRAKQVGVLERANGVKGHPVYLSVHGSAAGCNLMSFLCWFRLYRVTRVSRSFVFVFRVFQPPPPPPSPLPLFPPLELSSASDPFKIRLLSCRLGCRRLWLKAIRARRLLKRDHVLSHSLLKGRGIFYFRFSKRFSPATFSSEILPTMIPPYSLPPNLPWRIIDGFHRTSMNRGSVLLHLCPRWDASPIICRALDILLY